MFHALLLAALTMLAKPQGRERGIRRGITAQTGRIGVGLRFTARGRPQRRSLREFAASAGLSAAQTRRLLRNF